MNTPIACTQCDGNGGHWFAPASPIARRWGLGREEWVDCPRCHGTEAEPCDGCGEEPAVHREDGLVLCPGCLLRYRVEAAREAPEEPSQESNRLFQVRP